ncbi:MAG: Ig-like domain-containing protein [Acidobacteria bacterium]|nr:Ig-like domain-containing protein [Acidobacteriota bacterium]
MSLIGVGSRTAAAGIVVVTGMILAAPASAQQPIYRHTVLLSDTPAFNPGAQDLRVEGASAKREMGSALAFGDFNGDGFQDIAVGERKNNRVYIYFGRNVLDPAASNPGDPNAAYIVRPTAGATNDVPDVTITCGGCQLDPNNNSDFGFSLAGAEVTGDSRDDLIIGAPFDDAGGGSGADRGRVFVVKGRASFPSALDADADPQTSRITASGPNNKKYFLGFAVAAGDFDGDGVGDVAISSRGANFPLYAGNVGKARAGAVHVLTGFSSAEDISTDAAVRHIVGDGANDFFGESLAMCRFDGSGRSGLLIGAIGVDNAAQTNAGGMFVYKPATLQAIAGGKASAIRGANADSTVLGADKDDSLGFSVACGDINGDGFADPIVSAFFASGPGNNRPGVGEVFAFYGSAVIPDPNGLKAQINLRTDPPQLRIIGSTQGDQFGFSLASGNVNCDTDPNSGNPIDDIIVGARRYDSGDPSTPAKTNVGVTYAIRGSATRPKSFVMDLRPGTVTAGSLLNKPGNYPTVRSEVLDPNVSVPCDPNNPDDPDPNRTCAVVSILLGDVQHQQSGYTTAAGDFNGDGCAEIAVGAIGDTARLATYSGRVYLASLRDNDADLVSDLSDQDNDNDCIADTGEDVNGNGVVDPNETDRFVSDTDGDGLQDGTETGVSSVTLRGEKIFAGADCSLIDPAKPQCCLDHDAGVTKTKPLVADTDGDTIPDGAEDSDHNGAILGDTNLNGALDPGEVIGERDPNKKDTDGDGLDDNQETLGGCPSPLDADSDDDGLPDGCIPTANGASDCNDMRAGEDRNKNGAKDANETGACTADTDGDGLQDGLELGVGGPGVPGPNGQFDTASNQDGTDPCRHLRDQDPLSVTNPLLADTDNDCVPDGCIAGFNGGGGCPALLPATCPATVDPNFVFAGAAKQGEDLNLNGRVDGVILKGVAASTASPAAGTETDPVDHDSDSDGLDDGLEWGVTSGTCVQKDLDPATTTDPRDADSDNGTVADGLEDINANGRFDFNPATFVCGATQALDVNNETNPNSRLDDRGSDFARTPAPGFADPNNVSVTAYLQNRALVVLLDDTDENKDSLVAESIVLNATNLVDPNNALLRQGISCLVDDPNTAGNVDVENITLTETGPNTHLFRGTIPMAVGTPTPQNGTLDCNEDDRVRLAYRDDDDLCDQRQVLADVTLTQIRSVSPATAAPPITTPVTSVSAVFKEDLTCASVTAADFTVTGTVGPAAGAITCAADPNFPAFGGRLATLTFGAPLADDLYTFALDCDTPAPFIADLSGFQADCERPCAVPPLGNPAYCTSLISGNGTAGGAFASSFVVDNDSSPSVTVVSPANAQISTAPVTVVTATFSEAMDPNTIGTGSFGVATTMGTVTCATVGYVPSTKQAACTLAGQAAPPDDRYTVTLLGTGGSPMRDFAANALDGDNNGTAGADFVSTFVLDTDSSPSVVSVDPNNLQIITSSRPNLASVSATFSESMNPATITSSSFTVSGTMAALTPSSVVYTAAAKRATFTSNAGTFADDRYTVTLQGNGGSPIRDFAANALDGDNDGTAGADFTSTFVVDYDQVPAITMTLSPPGAVTVNPLVNITFKFDQSMEAATVTNPANWSVAGTMMTVAATSITYDPVNKTVTFDPSVSLPDDLYTVTLTGMTDQAGNLLDGDNNGVAGGAFVLTFAVDADSSPNVASADPASGQVVDPNRPGLDHASATFAEAMDASTISAASVTLAGTMGALTPSSVTYAPVGKTVTFTSNAGVLADDRYTLTLVGTGGGPIRDLAGNALDGDNSGTAGGDFTATFVIDYDQVPSIVALLSPAAPITVDPNVVIVVAFDQSMEASTVTDPNHWTVIGTAGVPIAGAIGYNPILKIATFQPLAPLPDDRYGVSISGMTDQAGNLLDGDGNGIPGGAFVFSFTVDFDSSPSVTATSPANGQALTAVRSTFTVTFSEEMDPASLTPASLQVRDAFDPSLVLNTLGLSVTYDPLNRMATITTDFPLGNGSYEIFADGTTGTPVRDLAGNALDGDNDAAAGGDFTSGFTIGVTGVFLRAVESAPDLHEVVVDPNSLGNQVRVRVSERPDTASVDPNTFLLTNSAGDVACDPNSFAFADQGSGSSKCQNCNLLCAITPTTYPDDRYTVTLKSDPNVPALRIKAKTSGGTNFLDGECSGGVCDVAASDFPTGNGTAGGDFVYTFFVDADAVPSVTNLSPTSGSTIGDPNANVVVTFDQRMDPNTLNATTFTVVPTTGGGGPVAGGYSFDPNTRAGTFDPGSPLGDGTYTLTLIGDPNAGNPSVRDFSAPVGNALDGDNDSTAGGNFVATFTVEAVAPTVLSTTPGGSTVVLAPPAGVQVLFSEPMDGSTITTGSFVVTSTMGSVSCSAVSYDAPSRTATCTLTGFGSPADDILTMTLAGNGGSPIRDLAGNALDGDGNGTAGGDFTAAFTIDTDMTPTVTAINPADSSTILITPTTVTATFSEPMAGASLTTSTFFVGTTTGGVSCASVTYNALLKTATCTLAGVAAPPDDLYTVTLLGTGLPHITDLAGNPLDGDNNGIAGGNFVSSFVVDTDSTPSVTATDPNDLETVNAPRTTVTVDFSEAMDSASLTPSTIVVSSNTTGLLLAPDAVAYVPALHRGVFTRAAGIPDDTYTLTVVGSGGTKVLDLAGNTLGAGNFTATFTIEAADPNVTATDPNNAQVKTSAPGTVIVTFSEPMDSNTIDTSSVLVATTAGGVSCTSVTYDPNTERATCTLSALATPPDDRYTVTVKGTGGSAAKDLAGNALGGGTDFTSFYVVDTDTTPTVTLSDPNNGQMFVSGPTTVTVDFSEAMDGSTIDATTFLVSGTGGSVTPTMVAYAAATKRATFTVAAPLSDDVYTITVRGAGSPAAKDFAGNSLGGGIDFTSTFTVNAGAPTVTAIDPNDLQIKTTFSSTQHVIATFSEAMDANTISTSTFLVTASQGGVSCSGVAYDPNTHKANCTLAITPVPRDDRYTVTLKGTGGSKIKDATGVVLDGDGIGGAGGDFVSTFVVDTDTTPTVTAINPANNSTIVSTPTTVTATFSEAIDLATVDATDFLVTSTVGTVSCGSFSVSASTRQATCTLTGVAANPDDRYTVMLLGSAGTGIKDFAGNVIADFTSHFVVNTDSTATITASDPNQSQTVTAAPTAVTVTFSEAMDPSTISISSILLAGSAGSITADSVTYDAATTTASFNFAAGLPDDSYTLTVHGSAAPQVKDFAGNNLDGDNNGSTGGDFSLAFVVDTDASPTITTVNPSDTQVKTVFSGAQTVTATFSEAMNAATITTSTFLVGATGGGVSCSPVTYNAATRVATCTLSGLPANRDDLYSVTLVGTGGSPITDRAGNALDGDGNGTAGGDFTSTFIVDTDTTPTVTATNPAGGSTFTGTFTTVTATFSEAMDGSTITTSSMTVTSTQGAASCSAVSYSAVNRRATCTLTGLTTPDDDVYTVDLSTAITDKNGNPLTAFSDSFVVDHDQVPAVVSTTPANGSSTAGVSQIDVLFDQAMDGTTITGTTFTVADTNGVAVAGTVSYDPTTRIATFTPTTSPFPAAGSPYSMHLEGTTGARVRDQAGHVLDGNGNGTAGGDFDATFTSTAAQRRPPAGPFDDGILAKPKSHPGKKAGRKGGP